MYVIRDTSSGLYFRTFGPTGFDYWTRHLSRAMEFESFEAALTYIRTRLQKFTTLVPEKL